MISFEPGISNFQYLLTTPENEVIKAPVVKQTFPRLCPYVCMIRDAQPTQDSVPSVISTIDTKGTVRVSTGNKALHDLQFVYELKCISTLSVIQQGTASNIFRVAFRDECEDAVITPAYFTSFQTLVFVPAAQPFVPA